MSQPIPGEDNPNGIKQQAENSQMEGGMQAIQGDNNIQLQDSNLVVQKIFENIRAGGNITVGDIKQIYQIVINLSDIPKPTGFPENIPSSGTDKFIGRERELESLAQHWTLDKKLLREIYSRIKFKYKKRIATSLNT